MPFANLITNDLQGVPFLSGNLLFHVFLPCQDHLFLVFPGETLVSVLKMLIKLIVVDQKNGQLKPVHELKFREKHLLLSSVPPSSSYQDLQAAKQTNSFNI